MLDFGFSPEKLSEIQFKSTAVSLMATVTPANSNLELEVDFPTFKLNGVPMTKGPFPLNSSTQLIDLSGYLATLTNNQFAIDINVYIKGHNGQVVVDPSTLKIDLTFNGMNYMHVIVFFGDKCQTNIHGNVIDIHQ